MGSDGGICEAANYESGEVRIQETGKQNSVGLLAVIGCAMKYLLILFIAATCIGADIQVYFSPKGGCTDAIVGNLNRATNSVLVQAYSFTSAPIAEALVNAKKRKVNVQVILDKSQRSEKYSSADFVAHAGIPTYIDTKHAIAHNKVIVIDGKTVLTGSFNFSKAAENSNAENLLVIQDVALAKKYTTNWLEHYKHSEKYPGR
jgi:phosphatidylserine/phosphatidylglycerophosphate/cardiolipin synthase-like enzyme